VINKQSQKRSKLGAETSQSEWELRAEKTDGPVQVTILLFFKDVKKVSTYNVELKDKESLINNDLEVVVVYLKVRSV
jgi:hypothetical protein